MTPNNNFSLLPFYSSVLDQNHRKDYSFGEIFPLFCPDGDIPMFQIIFWNTDLSESVTDFNLLLFDIDGNEVQDLSQDFINYATITQYADHTIVRYPGTQTGVGLSEGRYYLSLEDTYSDQTVYSEVFTVVNNLDNSDDFLCITYNDDEDLIFDDARVEYDSGDFEWKIYLPTQVGMPEYVFTEEAQERDGFNFIEKQISKKTYKFTFLAPEFLLDAMRIIRMSDNITITSKRNTYTVQDFLITPKWEEGGYLASVEAEFNCNTIVKKIGKTVT